MNSRELKAAAMRDVYLGFTASADLTWDELPQHHRDRWLAALAAVGPQYCPADVAFSSRVPELERQIADLHRQLSDARREVDEVRRHISVTMSREHQARKEAQEAKRESHDLRTQLARESEWVRQYKQDKDDALAELEVVKAERDEYLRMYENEQKNADHWKAKAALADAAVAELRDQIDDDNTNAAAVNDLLIKLQNVTAERDRLVDENKQVTIDYGIAVKSHNRQQESHVACKNEVDRLVSQLAAVTAERDDARDQLAASEIELADKAFYVREFAAVSAERDAARAEKQTLSDELQRVTAERDEARAEARAAIAHLRKRPEGLPTAEELKQVYRDGWNEGAGGDTCASGITAILAALAPWLREPVGWELDVTAEELSDILLPVHRQSATVMQATRTILDLCRSRIRPAATYGGWHFENGKIVPNRMPEGVPSVDELAEIGYTVLRDTYRSKGHTVFFDWSGIGDDEKESYIAQTAAIRDRVIAGMGAQAGDTVTIIRKTMTADTFGHEDGTPVPIMRAYTDADVEKLAPWLREPVGWELDVTWQDLYNTYQTKLCGLQGSWEAILDLCRSRIRPVFECKECAEWLKKYQERDYKYIKAQAETQAEGTKVYALENKIAAARAALEGE